MENMTIVIDGQEHRLNATAKTFSTGNTGYFVNAMVSCDGGRYSLSGNMVKIKEKSAAEKAALKAERKEIQDLLAERRKVAAKGNKK